MGDKKNEAVEVFRQFAWNLAGTLAMAKGLNPRPPRQRPAGRR
ncbi:MAG: hypothetical protein ABL866_16890 [Devosia sp.]